MDNVKHGESNVININVIRAEYFSSSYCNGKLIFRPY